MVLNQESKFEISQNSVNLKGNMILYAYTCKKKLKIRGLRNFPFASASKLNVIGWRENLVAKVN